jgi:hypothetical protein
MKKYLLAMGCAALVAGSLAAPPRSFAAGAQQPASASPEVKLKKEEFDAFKAVESAVGPQARLVAAKAFAEKFPASAAAPRVEELVMEAIVAAPTDPGLATNVTEFQTLYPNSANAANLQRFHFDRLVQASDWAGSSKVGEAYLTKWPDDVRLHFRLLEIGLEAAKKGDGAYVQSAVTHGTKALELFAADKKPADMIDADWTTFKQKSLPKAHQSLGLIAYVTADLNGAESHLKEAATLDPVDPFNHFFLGAVAEGRYRSVAEKFNGLIKKDSPDAKKLLDESATHEDALIGHFVKVVALGGDKPEYSQLVAQAKPALEEHYKHRHNNSLDGLDAMIAAAKVGK